MSKPFLKISADFTKSFNDIVNALKTKQTLVGIPEQKSTREADENGNKIPFNNAAILFINEFGSPVNNIPASKPMATGLRNAQEDIAEEFKKAGSAVWTKGQPALDQYYERAGMIASNSIKRVINDQEGFEEPAQATLNARQYLNNGNGFKGTKRLIVTGQTRNAITYVVDSAGLASKKGVR